MKVFHKTSILLTILFFFFFSASDARDSITPTQPLADDETLISSGGRFVLGFFSPTNSTRRYVGIWFNNVTDGRVVWVANRASAVVNSTGLMSITANGTLMITDEESTIVWSTVTTPGLNISSAQLLDNGNLVIKQDGDHTRRHAWQSFDHPTDTLLAGMKLGLDRITGIYHNLTAWKSETDPSEGEYHEMMGANTYLYIYSGSHKVWRSGQWDGHNLRNKGLNYITLNNSREMTLSFQESEQPTIFVISRLGKLQCLTWMSDSSQWNTTWEVPANQCDIYGHCGPNGICDIKSSPICKCLQGFRPKNRSKWTSGDWTDGCIRKSELDCRNGTDGFVAISGAKLPESSVSFLGNDLTLDECKLKCLQNCFCTAYAMYAREAGCVIWVTDSILISRKLMVLSRIFISG